MVIAPILIQVEWVSYCLLNIQFQADQQKLKNHLRDTQCMCYKGANLGIFCHNHISQSHICILSRMGIAPILMQVERSTQLLLNIKFQANQKKLTNQLWDISGIKYKGAKLANFCHILQRSQIMAPQGPPGVDCSKVCSDSYLGHLFTQ